MAQGFGRVATYQTGIPIQVSADGRPDWIIGGITIDWTTITAVAADTTIADGTIVPSGRKYLLYGQVLCKITATGLYGPYSATAADGRQNITRGECFILNRTQLEVPLFGAGVVNSMNPAVIEGGSVFLDRIQVGGAGQPSIQALLATFPRLRVVEGVAVVPPSNYPATLAVPTSFTATPGTGQISLACAAMPYAVEYIWLRGTVTGGPYVEVARTDSPAFINTALVSTTHYYYVAEAVYTIGTSGYSAEANAVVG